MPQGFYFMPSRDIDIWMPASFPPWMRTNFGWHNAQIVARLKPGITLEHARQSMAALSLQVTAKDFRGPHSVIVNPLREEMAGKTQTALIVLLVRVGGAAADRVRQSGESADVARRGARQGSSGAHGAWRGTRKTDRAIPHRKPGARRTRRGRRTRARASRDAISGDACSRDAWARRGSRSTGACWPSPPPLRSQQR